MFLEVKVKYILIALALFLSFGVKAESICYDGASGFNGHKNLTEICLDRHNKANIEVYYFNNLLPDPPTTCEGTGDYKTLEESKGFEINTISGTCENGNTLTPHSMICTTIKGTIHECLIKEYGVSFYVSELRKI